jgi:hypothetical protein
LTTPQTGADVITPSGRRGIVLTPAGGELMPLHCLIEFPSGDKTWVLAAILKLEAAP